MSPISRDTKEWHNSKHTAGNSLLSSHIYTYSHIQTNEPVYFGYFPDLIKVMLKLKIIMHNMQI